MVGAGVMFDMLPDLQAKAGGCGASGAGEPADDGVDAAGEAMLATVASNLSMRGQFEVEYLQGLGHQRWKFWMRSVGAWGLEGKDQIRFCDEGSNLMALKARCASSDIHLCSSCGSSGSTSLILSNQNATADKVLPSSHLARESGLIRGKNYIAGKASCRSLPRKVYIVILSSRGHVNVTGLPERSRSNIADAKIAPGQT
jgi:hypothetical protein